MFALNAQFGVDAGGKREEAFASYRACVLRASANGMAGMFPVYVETCSCAGQFIIQLKRNLC